MKKMTAFVALATFTVGNLPFVYGETNPQQRSETVRFGDLDVSTERGAARLFQRLTSAATHVCSDPGEAGHLPDMRLQRMQCRNHAIAAAVGALDAPGLTGIAREHGVEPLKPATSR